MYVTVGLAIAMYSGLIILIRGHMSAVHPIRTGTVDFSTRMENMDMSADVCIIMHSGMPCMLPCQSLLLWAKE